MDAPILVAGVMPFLNWTISAPVAGMALTLGTSRASRNASAWGLFSLWGLLLAWNIMFPAFLSADAKPDAKVLIYLPFVSAFCILVPHTLGTFIPRKRRNRSFA